MENLIEEIIYKSETLKDICLRGTELTAAGSCEDAIKQAMHIFGASLLAKQKEELRDNHALKLGSLSSRVHPLALPTETYYKKVSVKDTLPKKEAWYETDKGLFYYFIIGHWSCRDDKISKEYPNFWWKETQLPIQEMKLPSDETTKILASFFLWFREHGEEHINMSMENMINIYIQQQSKNEVK